MNKKIYKTRHPKRLSQNQVSTLLIKVKEIIIPFVVSFLTVFLLVYISPNLFKIKKEQTSAPKPKLKELIELEKYLYIDPMTVIKLIDSSDKKVMLVDIRDETSYKKAHIKGTVNYSIDQTKNNLKEFKNKKVIIYGDTSFSITSKEVALFLLEKGIDARLMSVGWNEFRHFKNLWVPESQWSEIDINKYIQTNE